MRMQLLIRGAVADCDPTTLIQMTYTREDLENPTIVRNSYSAGITLPATPANNIIFGHYHRPDRVTTSAGFNALAREPFEIRNDRGEILEKGYLRLVSCASKGAEVYSYSVQLYGGLGGFFYGLMYNEDGSKKTLADVQYIVDDERIDPQTTQMSLRATDVEDAWARLSTSRTDVIDLYDLINFSPCNNGLPACEFSADKAVFKQGVGAYIVDNLFTQRDGLGTRADADGHILLEYENEHTEWEVQELRAYLQRPVLRVLGFLRSIRVDGYSFVLDDALLFNDDYQVFFNTWLTLPMFDRDHLNPASFSLSDLLEGTDTPADYLIGFAKMFGCVFRYDPVTSTITMQGRDVLYNGKPTTDLTGRIDRSRGISIQPYPFDKRYYDMSLDTYGEFCKAYKDKYGREYGSQRIDTGWDFDKSAENLLDGCVYKGGADVVEQSPYFRFFGSHADSQSGYFDRYHNKFGVMESVKFTLYGMNEEATEEITQDYEPIPVSHPEGAVFRYDTAGNTMKDFMARLQLHQDGKAEDGKNVLLMYAGNVEPPHYNVADASFRLTDDNLAMMNLNDGVPCWNASADAGRAVSFFPSFRRGMPLTISGQTILRNYLGMGIPQEVAHPETPDDSLYQYWWQNYLADRFNVDSVVLTAYVDWKGLKVGENLLEGFYYYDGALWVLNKILNYPLNTDQPVQCEFVRVQDKSKYEDGQNWI